MRPIVFLLAVSACAAQQPTAESLIAAGHWKRARVLVEERLRAAPDDPNALFLASQIRNAFGDRWSPLPLAEKAVRLNGGVARYHRQLAEVEGVMAQHAGMLQQLLLARRFRKEIDIALELDPKDVQALRDLMEFHLLAPGIAGGDAARAGTIAQRIASIDITQGFLAQARIAEAGRNFRLMEVLLRKAADVRPTCYKALILLAQFYAAADHANDTEAENLAKRAMELEPGRVDAYSVLAAIYAGRREWDALESVLFATSREVPDDSTPYFRAAERISSWRRHRYLQVYLTQEPEGNEPTWAQARALAGGSD